ncbi:MAG: methyltransferase [Nitrospirae bacterium]|nr:methyltransferase [Nitrospirota bacterium]
MKIPLNPPFSKGENNSPHLSMGENNIPPFVKGGEGGFDAGFPDTTLDILEGVRIIQPKRGHRFTTDSVLLARLSNPRKYSRVLELGTGCGIVSILLAKRIPSLRITAVEIQEEMAKFAERNICSNNMESGITILNKDINNLPRILPSAHFDYVVTNPPYRTLSSGRLSPDKSRAVANHEHAITIDEILKVSRHLLKVRGKISLIYTADRLTDLFSAMRRCRIEPKVLKCLLTRGDGEITLVWVEGIREGKPGLKISCEPLV